MRSSQLLCEFLREFIQLKRFTYAECERQTGASWMTFRRVATGDVCTLRPTTQDALCKLFGVDIDTLRSIVENGGEVSEVLRRASGKPVVPPADTRYDFVEMSALWQWVSLSPMRVDILRAQGYRGALPAHSREAKAIGPAYRQFKAKVTEYTGNEKPIGESYVTQSETET